MVNYLFSGAAECALCFPDFKAVKVQKFRKGQRENLYFDTTAGEVGGVFGGQQVSIGSCDINVAIEINTERIHSFFPIWNTLNLVKKQIHPFAGRNVLPDIIIEIITAHAFKSMRFEVHFKNLIIGDAVLFQMKGYEFKKAGFAASADPGDYLNWLRILKCKYLI